MTFTWPLALAALIIVPVAIGLYVWQLHRKRRNAVRYSNVALLRSLVPVRARWKRHVPVGLFATSLLALGFSSARPNITSTVPLGRTSIILALDVSRSMCATDVEPNRLTIAQQAARAFVADQPSGTRIGIVAFSGFAELVVPPTTDKEHLIGAIDALTTSRGTVIGSAILKSLDAIAEINPDVAPVGTAGGVDAVPAPVVPAGEQSYVPDIVVVLTDGANTRGIKPVDAAEYAVERRVRVYTIGFGTENPTAMVCTREQLGGDVFGENDGGFPGGGFPGGGGGPGGRRRFLVIDEPTLKAVAEATGGQYFRAEDADQLRSVFADLPKQVELQTVRREISVGFVLAGALIAALAVALSMRWNPFP
jgi:Ca-activated chloride channel family protein